MGRHYAALDWRPFAPGVGKIEWSSCDLYKGTADALILAGLCRDGQFPGQAGMRKVVVTIYADGSVAEGPPTRNDPRKREPGAVEVVRSSGSTFRVRIVLSEGEAERRRRKEPCASGRWIGDLSSEEEHLLALFRNIAPQRRKSVFLAAEASADMRRDVLPLGERAAHLRLVWSAS